jgi:hypothetical protein
MSVAQVGKKNGFARRLLVIWYVSALLLPTAAKGQVEARIISITARKASLAVVPLKIGNLTGKNVTAFEFIVSCDTSLLVLKGVEQKGTLTEGLTMFANNRVTPFGPGHMKVVCATATAIVGDGVLVNILVSVRGKSGKTRIALSDFVLNAGTPAVKTRSGNVAIVSDGSERIPNRNIK